MQNTFELFIITQHTVAANYILAPPETTSATPLGGPTGHASY
jgi:hypothetical protein